MDLPEGRRARRLRLGRWAWRLWVVAFGAFLLTMQFAVWSKPKPSEVCFNRIYPVAFEVEVAARPNQIESATRDACYRLERRADEIGIGIDEQVDRFLRDYRTVGFAEAVMLNS